MTWQVLLNPESGHWKDFEEMQQQQFTMNHENGIPECPFFVGRNQYVLDFDRMVQRNVATNVTRQVRYVLRGSTSPPQDSAHTPLVTPPDDRSTAPSPIQVWQWQAHDGPDGWRDLDRPVNEIIGTARALGQASCEFQSGGNTYTANFLTNMQRNVRTGKERPLRPKARQEL